MRRKRRHTTAGLQHTHRNLDAASLEPQIPTEVFDRDR